MQNDKFDKKNDNIRPSLSPCFLDIINIRNVMEIGVNKDQSILERKRKTRL